MVGHLLARGMLVGLVAGLMAFGFARLFGEPPLESAIAFEAHAHDAHTSQGETASAHAPAAHDAEPELVSRSTQSGLGLLTGAVVYGAAIGGLFALAFAFVHGRIGDQGPRATAALLALAGFVAIVLVPALKYPANPPAIGEPETIGARTAWFFVMLAMSLTALVAAVALARGLWTRWGAWNAWLIAAAAYIAVIAAVQYVLPEINEVPEHFSAVVLWRFRVAALGMQLVLWAVIGLLFGVLTERGGRPG